MNFSSTIMPIDGYDSSLFTAFIYKKVPYPDPHEKIMICHVSFDYIRLPSHKIQIDFEHETIKWMWEKNLAILTLVKKDSYLKNQVAIH